MTWLDDLRCATEDGGRQLDKAKARGDIDEAVAVYRMAREDVAGQFTPAKRRDHYRKLLNTVRKAREQYEQTLEPPRLIDPLVWTWGDPDWEHVEKLIKEIVRNLQSQEKWLEGALKDADSCVSRKGGRTRGTSGVVQRLLISGLANVWELHTFTNAGYTRPTDGSRTKGPFIHFVKTIARDFQIHLPTTNLPEYVADVLTRRRDKDHAKEWIESKRDPLLDKFSPK